MGDYLTHIRRLISDWDIIPKDIQQEILSELRNSSLFEGLYIAADCALHVEIDPVEIHEALAAISINPSAFGGNRPTFVKNISTVFTGRENKCISLTEIVVCLGKIDDSKGRKYAASMISWLNREFKERDIRLEIGSENLDRYHNRKTYYHFRRPAN